MLQQLLETGAARERRWGWIMPSVAVHVAIITAVAFAPAGGVEAPTPLHVDTIIYSLPAPHDRPIAHGGAAGSIEGGGMASLPQPDFDAATPPQPGMPPIWPSSADSAGLDGLLRGDAGTSLTSGPEGVIGEATVDEPVRVRVESVPRYPAQLRATRVGGIVEMEFVVDTTGHADLATVRVISSSDERFTAAVRSALRNARFAPGRYQGHPVRTLVRRAYRFELESGR